MDEKWFALCEHKVEGEIEADEGGYCLATHSKNIVLHTFNTIEELNDFRTHCSLMAENSDYDYQPSTKFLVVWYELMKDDGKKFTLRLPEEEDREVM